MTFISLTQAARQLGIDGKTLQHWLRQAHLTPQAHPTDARQKGVSRSQLHALAEQHQRRLPAGVGDPAAPAASASPTPDALPDDLLAQLRTLAEVPAQLAAVQQHLQVLLERLERIERVPAAPHQKSRETPTSRAARTPVAPSPAKPAQVLARVEYAEEGHYVIMCPTHGVLPFEPDSREWVGWLASQRAFRFVGHDGHLTAHREVDRLHPRPWRAHRKLRNQTCNLPLAHSEGLTIAVLEQAAATFQAQLR